MDVLEQVNIYKKYGFRPFPLAPYSKRMLKDTKFETVENLPFSYDSNIGLFVGSPSQFLVIDLDDEKAQNIVMSKFKEIGLLDQISIVKTPQKGGYHLYLRVDGVPENIKPYYGLPKEIGKGEIRCKWNAYVVAPGGVLAEGRYDFYQGSLENYLAQPVIQWKDLDWVLPKTSFGTRNNLYRDELLNLPIQLIYRPEPHCLYLLKLLRKAKKGEKIDRIYSTGEIIEGHYQSRSEAEGALVTGLILSGWVYEGISEIFEQEQPGHYKERSDPDDYLTTTYNNAIEFLLNREHSDKLVKAYEITQSTGFSGRGGDYDKRVIEAVLAKGWEFDTFEPSISLREICEYAAINNPHAISKVLARLHNRGMIVKIPTKQKETTRINIAPYVNDVIKVHNIPPVINVYLYDENKKVTSELWSRRFLGGTARCIYPYLTDKEQSVAEIVNKSKKSLNAVKNALEMKLLPHKLAEKKVYGWVTGSNTLTVVAQELNVETLRKEREYKHKKERDAFSEINR